MRVRRIYWESDCGHSGSINTNLEALGPLVRAARCNHDRRFPQCQAVDIERVETEAEREARLRPQPSFRTLKGFC